MMTTITLAVAVVMRAHIHSLNMKQSCLDPPRSEILVIIICNSQRKIASGAAT